MRNAAVANQGNNHANRSHWQRTYRIKVRHQGLRDRFSQSSVMNTLAETRPDQKRTATSCPMPDDSTQSVNDHERGMLGGPLGEDCDANGSAETGIPYTSGRLLTKKMFESDTVSACTADRADLIEHCEQLRTANIQLRARHREFEDDLVVAARVQQQLEPKPIVWGRVRVDTFSQPARTIGGDFGMVCPLDKQHLNLLLGDVSGHGISAALAASRIYTETSAHLQTGAPLGEVLSALNRSVIRKFNSSSFFFTVAAARVDRSGRHMAFAGAGHPPCMVIKPGANLQLLEARSMMLGALSNAVRHEPTIEVDLEPGDRILLYTDGVTEVFDESGEMLGVEGLQNVVRENSRLAFDEMVPAILKRIADWRQGPFVDDVTLLLAEVLE
jgi:phosphoserine phosphatase RsbU/P